MSKKELLERIEDLYDYDDILYIIGKNKMWLLQQIQEEILEHRKDFLEGDSFYSEITEDE